MSYKTTIAKNIGGTLATTVDGDFVESNIEAGKSATILNSGGAVMPANKKKVMSKPTIMGRYPKGAFSEEGLYAWFPVHNAYTVGDSEVAVVQLYPTASKEVMRLADYSTIDEQDLRDYSIADDNKDSLLRLIEVNIFYRFPDGATEPIYEWGIKVLKPFQIEINDDSRKLSFSLKLLQYETITTDTTSTNYEYHHTISINFGDDINPDFRDVDITLKQPIYSSTPNADGSVEYEYRVEWVCNFDGMTTTGYYYEDFTAPIDFSSNPHSSMCRSGFICFDDCNGNGCYDDIECDDGVCCGCVCCRDILFTSGLWSVDQDTTTMYHSDRGGFCLLLAPNLIVEERKTQTFTSQDGRHVVSDYYCGDGTPHWDGQDIQQTDDTEQLTSNLVIHTLYNTTTIPFFTAGDTIATVNGGTDCAGVEYGKYTCKVYSVPTTCCANWDYSDTASSSVLFDPLPINLLACDVVKLPDNRYLFYLLTMPSLKPLYHYSENNFASPNSVQNDSKCFVWLYNLAEDNPKWVDTTDADIPNITALKTELPSFLYKLATIRPLSETDTYAYEDRCLQLPSDRTTINIATNLYKGQDKNNAVTVGYIGRYKDNYIENNITQAYIPYSPANSGTVSTYYPNYPQNYSATKTKSIQGTFYPPIYYDEEPYYVYRASSFAHQEIYGTICTYNIDTSNKDAAKIYNGIKKTQLFFEEGT